MRQIAILSGKGGTGKTSISAAFISIVQNGVFADCDVDAADLHIILQPQIISEHIFEGGRIVSINQDLCSSCNKCFEVCEYDAINRDNKLYSVNKFACEGCGFCVRVCPDKAIDFNRNNAGKWYLANTRFGKFVYAKLFPGEENSGKLVTMVRHQAKIFAEEENADYIIIDGPPGIGCPVISALSGVDDLIIVTEPTKSGLSDLKRIADTAHHFKLPINIIINKYNLNEDMTKIIEQYCNEKNYTLLEKIPFDKIFVHSMIENKSVIEYDKNSPTSKILINIAKKLNIKLKKDFENV